jgi:serine/threonine protein kinase
LHRDLRPSNLLVSLREDGGPVLKICDLGLFRPLDKIPYASSTGSLSMKFSGSYPYQPMEVVSATHQDDYARGGRYSVASDTYSAGLCVHFLLTNGFHPLLYIERRNQAPRLKSWYDTYYSSEDDVVMKCRTTLRQARATAEEDAKEKKKAKIENDEGLILGDNFHLDRLSHLPVARDLVLKMMGGKFARISERISLTEALQHPFFWSYDIQYEFIETVRNAFSVGKKSRDPTVLSCLADVENQRGLIMGKKVGDSISAQAAADSLNSWNWKKISVGDDGYDKKWSVFVDRVDKSLDQSTNPNYVDEYSDRRQPGYIPYKYQEDTVYGLLSMIRNVKNHLNNPSPNDFNFPRDMKFIMGRADMETLMGMITNRFPGLILVLVENTKRLKSQDQFESLFRTRIKEKYGPR